MTSSGLVGCGGGFMSLNFFACGATSRGRVHFEKIQEYVEKVDTASTQGSVYRLEVGYPVFSCEGGDRISGDLLSISAPEIFFRILDSFYGFNPRAPEKSLFLKVDVVMETTRGPVSGQTYSINPSKLPKTAVRIEGGDWQSTILSQTPLADQLSERQKIYVRKLGASSGRDIVPINLDLYRELMNLGLIVDKGRRLALTQLGQEVYRFLD